MGKRTHVPKIWDMQHPIRTLGGMGAPRKVPSDVILAKWREEGLTLNEIVDRIERQEGVRVARSTVASALSRAGLTDRVRYDRVIPWTPIKVEHNAHYALTMLRLLARRRSGFDLTEDQASRLDSWLVKLKDDKAVVTYVYDSPDGFYYVPREPGDPRDIPIRRPA